MNHLAQLVKNTYTKYNINFEKNIIFTNEEHKFRVSCLKEEWNEYLESMTREDSLDALVDLLYFVFGTIERQVGIENFIFKEVYTDVLINVTFEADESIIFGTLNTDYAKNELKWYESQSLNVYDIPDKVPQIWINVSDKDGFINSNYGWCIFSEENKNQFDNVVKNS